MKIQFQNFTLLYSGDTEYERRLSFIKRMTFVAISLVLTFMFSGPSTAFGVLATAAALFSIVTPSKIKDMEQNAEIALIAQILSFIIAFFGTMIISGMLTADNPNKQLNTFGTFVVLPSYILLWFYWGMYLIAVLTLKTQKWLKEAKENNEV
jgi:hypothetical protein